MIVFYILQLSLKFCIFTYFHQHAVYFELGFDVIEEGHGNPLQYSVLWPVEIPQTEEPGRLQSVGSCRVGHD